MSETISYTCMHCGHTARIDAPVKMEPEADVIAEALRLMGPPRVDSIKITRRRVKK